MTGHELEFMLEAKDILADPILTQEEMIRRLYELFQEVSPLILCVTCSRKPAEYCAEHSQSATCFLCGDDAVYCDLCAEKEGCEMTPKKSRLHSIWHQWMNKWATDGGPHEYSLYAFKDLLPFLEHGHHRLKQAFQGELPQTHQQCSHAPLEEIPEINELRCIMGINVVECTLLHTLKEVFEDYAKKAPSDEVSPDDVYQLMAETCAWHMFTKYCEDRDSEFLLDYREGWLRDKSDEMFWERTYRSMAMPDEPDEDVPDN